METEGISLTELLDDEAVDTPEIEDAAPVEQEPARDETGQFAAKGEESASPAPVTDDPPLEHPALIGERRRRQEAEERLRLLESQINSQPKEPPAPPPSLWDDENAWGGSLVDTAVQRASLNARLDMSEMLARKDSPDFDDMKTEFLRMAETNPAIVQQAMGDPHPWAKAYQIAKNARTMTELGATDLDSLRAKLREEVMAELQGQRPAAPGLPPTLSTERNVGARSGPAWSGPPSLSELLE